MHIGQAFFQKMILNMYKLQRMKFIQFIAYLKTVLLFIALSKKNTMLTTPLSLLNITMINNII